MLNEPAARFGGAVAAPQAEAALLARLAGASVETGPYRLGRLAACDGQLLEVRGLAAPIGALARVETGPGAAIAAETIGFRNGRTLMLALADPQALMPGALVRLEGDPGRVPVGHAYLGRAIDGSGRAIDRGPALAAEATLPLHGTRGNPLDRDIVREPFDVGVRAINGLITMGVGQRIGLMAGSGVGKSVLIGMIARAARAEVVIVGLIGERAREVADFEERSLAGPRRDRAILVAVPADHPPTLRIRGALHATALAEHFRNQGRQVLLIMDSLTRVAHAAREVGLLLGEPAAARGYPPSALALLNRIVERAGIDRTTGGSITALYTVLADGDDQSDPVVDTARAILDGHIVLSRALAERGQYPAIDVGASLSRVMSDVATRPHLAAARRFRALASHYEAHRDLILMGAYRPGSDPELDRAMALEPAMRAYLMQETDAPATTEASIAALTALIGEG